MAVKIADLYLNTNPADSNYPGGSFKNASSPTATDGTPFEEQWANDMLGFMQSLLAMAGIVPSGAPDTAVNSQHLAAVLAIAAGGAAGVKTITQADSPYTVTGGDSFLLVDATLGPVAVNFLSAADSKARRLTVKKTDATENAVQCTPQAAQEVEGEAGSYDSVMPGEFMSFVPDGAAAWHRVG